MNPLCVYQQEGLNHFILDTGKDGRAGMAALTLKEPNPAGDLTRVQLQEIFDHCADQLPK